VVELVNLGGEKFGIQYRSKFFGIKDGDVVGEPIQVNRDTIKIVHNDPEVKIIISNYSKGSNHISMHIKINVDIPVIGEKTMYDKTLGGDYLRSIGWEAALANVGAFLEEQKKIESTGY